jgi:hypothetical protein
MYCFQPSTKGVSFASLNPANKPGFKVNSSLGFSSDFGIGFTGFFSRQVGIHTSVGFGLFNVKSKMNLYYITPDFKDRFGYVYDLHTQLLDYTEIHKAMFVTIPVMLQFQTKQKQYWDWTRSQKAGFYALGGVKVNLLFNNRYEAGVDQLFNAGYFPKEDNWQATQTFAGLGYYDGINTEGKLDFGVMVLFACETGVKWRIDNNIFVYTGVFFDCALNDPTKEKRQPYGNFTAPEYLPDLTLLKFSERVNFMAVGIKLRFAFTKQQRPY